MFINPTTNKPAWQTNKTHLPASIFTGEISPIPTTPQPSPVKLAKLTSYSPHHNIHQTAIMKFAQSSVIALLAPAVAGRFVEANERDNVQLYPLGFHESSPEQYLIELREGVTQWVTEDEKWALKRVRSTPSMPAVFGCTCADFSCPERCSLYGHHHYPGSRRLSHQHQSER